MRASVLTFARVASVVASACCESDGIVWTSSSSHVGGPTAQDVGWRCYGWQAPRKANDCHGASQVVRRRDEHPQASATTRKHGVTVPRVHDEHVSNLSTQGSIGHFPDKPTQGSTFT